MEPEKAAFDGYGEALVTSLVALVLVLVVVWLVVRFAGRWLSTARGRFAGRGPIQVLARTSLDGGGCALHLVAVGDKTLLLATGEGRVELITEVDGAAVARDLERQRSGTRRSFHELLAAALERTRRGPDAATGPVEGESDDAGLVYGREPGE